MIRTVTGVGLPFPDRSVWKALVATGAELRCDEPIADYTTIRIGGIASTLIRPRELEQLRKVLKTVHEIGLSLDVLGGGSNLVVVGNRLTSIVLHTRRLDWIVPEPGGLRCGGGALLVAAIRRAISGGLAGLEGLCGIPATVGGAVYMNAGGKHAEMAEFVKSVTVIDREGRARQLAGSEIPWKYRSSGLADGIVAEVRLALPGGADPVALRERYDRILEEKAAAQPLSDWSAGCVFRNPPGQSAGALIDRAGLKGARVGGTVVSSVHANFIVNTGRGSPADFTGLMNRVQNQVSDAFGVRLEPEVVLWP